jgi:hypothetical protein
MKRKGSPSEKKWSLVCDEAVSRCSREKERKKMKKEREKSTQKWKK